MATADRRIQYAVVGVLTAVYGALAATLGDDVLRAIAGCASIAATALLARRLGQTLDTGIEVFVVWFATSALMLIVLAGPRYASVELEMAVQAFGGFCALAAYASSRFSVLPARPDTTPVLALVGRGIRQGLKLALIVCAVATFGVMVAAGLPAEEGAAEPLLTARGYGIMMTAYLTAGLVGGSMIGVLRSLVRLPVGAMVLGVLLATAGYSAVSLAMYAMGDEPSSLKDALVAGVLIGCIAGPLAGLKFRSVLARAVESHPAPGA